jgi:hypothetical protein
MRCEECGADPPGGRTCLDHFHALLAAETDNAELRGMHGLTVLIYSLQHPSLTKPWYQIFGSEVMRRVFGDGERWGDVLMESHPKRIGRRADAAVARLKAAGGAEMPDWVIAQPIAGELTVTAVSPTAPSGQTEQVLAWAKSVAEHRFLATRGCSPER